MKFLVWSMIFAMTTIVTKSQELCKELNAKIFDNQTTALQNNNLTVVHIGSFENFQSIETIRNLNKLQIEIPEIKVIVATHSNFENRLPLQDLRHMYNLAIPIIAVDKETVLQCVKTVQPTTLVLDPHQEIVKTYHALPKLEEAKIQLEDLYQEIQNLYPTDGSPFYGKQPHNFQKSNLIECPDGIAIDFINERIFISDYCQNIIIALSPFGEILEVIGTLTPGDEIGELSEASFDGPRGLTFDTESQKLYIADSRNNAIKVIDYNAQKVLRITIDSLIYPTRIDKSGADLFISSPHFIWRYNIWNNISEKINTDTLYQPLGIAISRKGEVFFAESGNSSVSSIHGDRIKRIRNNPKNELIFPAGMAFYDHKIITTDIYKNAVFMVQPSNFKSKPIAGNFEPGYKNDAGKNAMFNMPSDLAIWGNTAYITDMGNGLIRKIDLITNQVSTLNLIDYVNLSYRYSPQIYNLQEADTFYLPFGKNSIDINLSFANDYELDKKGFSYLSIASRNKTLNTVESILTNRTPSFELEIDEKNTEVLIDFYLFFRNREVPEKVFKQSFSFQVPIRFSSKLKDNHHELNVIFDPDQFED